MTRIHLLDFPWEMRSAAPALGAKYDPKVKAYTYEGDKLPDLLKPFAAPDFSWHRWREDQLNKSELPTTVSPHPFTPRDHQLEAAKKIAASEKRGFRGFIEADQVGLGKGLSASTKIPTPDGLTAMGELKEGDLVYGYNGEPVKVLEKYTSKATKFYRITFSDGSTILADEDHRWLTSTVVERQRDALSPGRKQMRLLSSEANESLVQHLREAQSEKLAVTVNSCLKASNRESVKFVLELLAETGHIGKEVKARTYHPQEVLEKLQMFLTVMGNRWSMTGEYRKTESVKTTKEVFDSQLVHRNSSTIRNHSIKTCLPVIGNFQELPIDPYVLGVWLGDRSTHHSTITSMDIEIIERVAEYFPKYWKTDEASGESSTYRFEGMQSKIRDLYGTPQKGKLEKYIPQKYLNASIDQRMDLLRGLLDTDGSILHHCPDEDGKDLTAESGVTFSQKDRYLFFQVYSLVCSMGWKATWRSKEVSFFKGGVKDIYYELLFFPDKQVFSLPRKANLLAMRMDSYGENERGRRRYITEVVEIAKEEEYYCISVDSDDHLYLCTESFIPTHNTLSTIFGAYGVAKLRKFTPKRKAKILIVCPKSVIPHWRNTLAASPLPEYGRIVIINYEQLNNLLKAPASAGNAKKTRTKNKRIASQGTSLVKWDIIIADESHKLKNFQESQRSKAFANVARYGDKDDEAPFVIYASATPGQNPLELGYAAPVIGQLAKRKLSLSNYGKWLEDNGFEVKKGKVGYSWAQVHFKASETEKQRVQVAKKEDITQMRKLLFSAGAPSIRRLPTDIAGWPEQNRIAIPVALDERQKSLYEELWTQFRSVFQMLRRGKDPKGGLAQQLRFRQKSSLLRIPGTIDHVQDLLDNNLQVGLSVEFMESLDLIRTGLEKKGYKCTEFSGRQTGSEREEERLRFQRGEADVILFTVTEAISLHANERLPDNTKASPTQRATVVHDVRYSGISNSQIEGRCARDGEFATIYYMFAEDTVEDKITRVMFERMANISDMAGDDQTLVDKIESLLADE